MIESCYILVFQHILFIFTCSNINNINNNNNLKRNVKINSSQTAIFKHPDKNNKKIQL